MMRVGNAGWDSGAAYVYKINQDDTVTLLDTLIGDPNNPLGDTDYFGWSVSISNGYIVVGAYFDDGVDNTASNSGAAYVYKINQDDTVTLLDTLRGDPNNPLDNGDYFGSSVSISNGYIVVGAYFDDGVDNTASKSGAAYVYKINQDDTVTLLDTLRGDPNNPLEDKDDFGLSVSISGDYIVVGASGDDGVGNATDDFGAAYVYKINQDDTITLLDTLIGDPNNPLEDSDRFGSSVSISNGYILVSARTDDGVDNTASNSGAAYVYKGVE